MANDLQELAQILQLGNVSQQPQLEQQRMQQQSRAANVAAMLQLLQLHQQGQAEQNRLGVEQGRIGVDQGRFAEEGRHNKALEGQAADNDKRIRQIALMHDATEATRGGQPMTPSMQHMMGAIDPELGQMFEKDYWDNAAKSYDTNKDAFAKVFQAGKPEATAAFGTMQHMPPEAQQWAMQYAQSLAAPTPPPAAGVMPSVGEAPREGGFFPWLHQTGILPTFPNAQERVTRAQQLWDAPDSPISLLFGRKTQPTATPAPTK